ncbi:MAG TPA: ParB/RepB/Spo0J family partition protein [Firmicutes bacterium]|nr:ParB/RepB/Spo0J family partition protein [Bacillota bacterium]
MPLEIIEVPIKLVRRDPNQVRKIFNKESLVGLAKSMEEVGLLHPILVKEVEGGYQLIAGERRLRAAIMNGKETIAAIILKPGVPVKQLQLIENLQREDLNPVERALAVHEFMTMEKLNKVVTAKRLGIPRTTITDWLDVLEVEERYQRALIDNFNGGNSPLTLSHISEARALANKLRSPAICNVVLDAVLEYKLSKVETREVCALVRSNSDVSVEEAVKLVRRPADVQPLPKEAEDERMAVQRNIDRWVSVLERSEETLTQLRRIAPFYLPAHERQRILDHLQQIRTMLDQTVDHIIKNADKQPLPPQVKHHPNKKQKKKKNIS